MTRLALRALCALCALHCHARGGGLCRAKRVHHRAGWRHEAERRQGQSAVGGAAAGAIATDPEQHRVHSLPGLAPNESLRSAHYAGLLPANPLAPRENLIFYWLFLAESSPQERPLVVWLNGGPGCSSFDGLFIENGPFRLTPPPPSAASGAPPRVSAHPHSWHKLCNMLYVDQPAGTGMSTVGSGRHMGNQARKPQTPRLDLCHRVLEYPGVKARVHSVAAVKSTVKRAAC